MRAAAVRALAREVRRPEVRRALVWLLDGEDFACMDAVGETARALAGSVHEEEVREVFLRFLDRDDDFNEGGESEEPEDRLVDDLSLVEFRGFLAGALKPIADQPEVRRRLTAIRKDKDEHEDLRGAAKTVLKKT